MKNQYQKISSVVVTEGKRVPALKALLEKLKTLTDEVVVILNTDKKETEQELLQYAHIVKCVSGGQCSEEYAQTMLDTCTGDWILKVDDDEILDECWSRERLQELIQDEEAMYYCFPRRWYVNETAYIINEPWYPDYQVRMFRNLPSAVRLPEKKHEQFFLSGEERRADDLYIRHCVLLDSREEREKKAAKYRRLNKYDSRDKLYLYEDYNADCQSEDEEHMAHVINFAVCKEPEEEKKPFQIKMAEIFIPKEMMAEHIYYARVEIENHASRSFYPSSNCEENHNHSIYLSYHLYKSDPPRDCILEDGMRTTMPVTLRPGEKTTVLFPIEVPKKEGTYLIKFDMVEEGIAWFSFCNSVYHVPTISFRVRNATGFSYEELKERKKVFYLGYQEDDDLGSHMLACGTKQFIQDSFQDYHYMEYPAWDMEHFYKIVPHILNSEDILILHGGSTLGNRYVLEEEQKGQIIAIASEYDCRVICMPQTVYYENITEQGRKKIKEAQKQYAYDKLWLLARGGNSFITLKKYFDKCHVSMFPDMSLYLKGKIKLMPQEKSTDVALILRNDVESVISEDDICAVLEKSKYSYKNIRLSYSTGEDKLCPVSQNREWYVKEKLQECAGARMIVTDRMQGVFAAYLLDVPCVFLRTVDYKLADGAEVLMESGACYNLGDNFAALEGAIGDCLSLTADYQKVQKKLEYSFQSFHHHLAKKKIAFVNQRYGLEVNGGSELQCRQLAERLLKYFDVEVFTSCALDYDTWRNHYEPGIEIIHGVTVRRFQSEREREKDSFNQFCERILGNPEHTKEESKEWILQQGPLCSGLISYVREHYTEYKSIIFMTYLYYPTAMGMTLQLPNALLLPTAHDEQPIYLKYYKDVFKAAKGIIYETEEEKEFVEKMFQVEKIPSMIGGSGVDLPDMDKIPSAKEKYQLEDYILYAGRIDIGKNCDKLFEYFKKYKQNHQSALKLVLIGKAVMDVPVQEDIIHIGFVSEEDKFALMRDAKALVLASEYESLSMVVLESMSVGIPVLVNGNSPVLKGHCEKSHAGLYFKDYGQFEQNLNLLLTQEERRLEMGENGKQYIHENYQWDVILEKIVRLVEETC